MVFVCILNLSFADKVVVSNTAGADSSSFSTTDFISPDGVSFYDRTQLDLNFKFTEGRWRFDFGFPAPSYSPECYFSGYQTLNLPYVTFAAGNSYFSKFDLKAGSLHASDETPSYGKLLKSGIGVYSEIPVEKSKKIKLGAACNFDSFTEGRFILDVGADFVWKKVFSAGFSAKDITSLNYGKYSLFAGFNAGDFRFDGGFIYNNTDSTVLPQETKYSLSGSVEYKHKKIYGAFDLVSGLNSEYLASTAKKTNVYSDNGVPFMMAGLFSYEAADNLKLDLSAKYQNMINQSGSYSFMICPKCEVSFFNEMLQVEGGLRGSLYSQSGINIIDLTVPLTVKFQYRWD